jgi:hypothetical protein
LGIGGRFAEISSNTVPGKERTLRIVFTEGGKDVTSPKNNIFYFCMMKIYFCFWQIRIWNFFFHLWQFRISNLIIVFNYYDCWAEIYLKSTNYLTMTLVSQHNIYINCMRTNGTTMLKSADHDSMSGEHLGTTSGLIMRSGKSDIWPLVAPENQGLRELQKSQKEGKKT